MDNEKHLHIAIGYRNEPPMEPYFAWQANTELGDIWYADNTPYDSAEVCWLAASKYMDANKHWPARRYGAAAELHRLTSQGAATELHRLVSRARRNDK